jgi:hypothetical protein
MERPRHLDSSPLGLIFSAPICATVRKPGCPLWSEGLAKWKNTQIHNFQELSLEIMQKEAQNSTGSRLKGWRGSDQHHRRCWFMLACESRAMAGSSGGPCAVATTEYQNWETYKEWRFTQLSSEGWRAKDLWPHLMRYFLLEPLQRLEVMQGIPSQRDWVSQPRHILLFL